MNGMIVFVLFLAFLFGAGMLALVAGFMDVEKRRLQEKKRSEAEALRAVPTVASEPRFFARLDANPLSAQCAYEDRMLTELQNYVRSEQVLAKQFVNEPSVDRLYRQPTLSVDIN